MRTLIHASMLLLLFSTAAFSQITVPLQSTAWITESGDGAYSPVTLYNQQGNLDFMFPAVPLNTNCIGYACNSIGWLAYTYYPGVIDISSYSEVSIALKMTAAPVTQWNYKFEIENTCQTPATTRALIWGSSFDDPNARWYSQVAYTLANGQATLVTPLTDTSGTCYWTNTNGQCNSLDSTTQAGWQQAITHVAYLSLVYGGGCFFDHGVNVSPLPQSFLSAATFKLVSYQVQ